ARWSFSCSICFRFFYIRRTLVFIYFFYSLSFFNYPIYFCIYFYLIFLCHTSCLSLSCTSSSCTTSIPLRFSDRKSTRLNSSHVSISYAVFCLKTKRCLHRHNS